jgi:hypothetical protein
MGLAPALPFLGGIDVGWELRDLRERDAVISCVAICGSSSFAFC